ncbi:flagellar basal body protein FliL [Alkalihalobacillus alcalophilus ATCC 27647 = CGMCC 1.3604]|uniref:Flagellar protein FliL n=1 Tax=Alkalihalobacillus alcalophilus ATCC 27647 = CGMCC 1.3604 TaxID=1218173 RepID=A0A094WQG8_ALKAL|nr:flagellar basal body-associated protein FliL [Alkalihalobacillus alcalophilus]KGA98243.1 flagellar basal body-associated protein FliL [Alkalihalobacillus alcalophilus ATCC 27647 = CGMCC 1.3604]MED1562182.1 flagellar basal body-associated protein FliL [Alkalihalobacillus alcalophilus]THG91407.1 flagellar basal body protein FliL [Alkalihalobacillus alcalophilus ATCC 27647 = CGMCC 1.3604]
MKKNKILTIVMIILIALTLVGVIAIVVVNQFNQPAIASDEASIEQIISVSYETEQIVTNLKSNDFIRVSFFIQLDSDDSLKELEKRDFQVNHLILHTLSEKTASELEGREGMEELEKELKTEINQLLSVGEVVRVYTTSWVIQ